MYRLEVLVGRATAEPRWQPVQTVASEREGLAVASRLCSVYEYRLVGDGVKYLDWTATDATGEEFKPVWVERVSA